MKRLLLTIATILMIAVMFSVSVSADGYVPAGRVSIAFHGTDGSDNEKLFESYVQGLFYPGEVEAAGDYAGSQLSGTDAIIYSILRANVGEVAEGKEDSTVFTVPVNSLGLSPTVWTAEQLGVDTIIADEAITEEAASTALGNVCGNLDRIVSALLADCPYELYWYDKVTGTSVSADNITARYDEILDCDVIEITGNLIYQMSVAAAYREGEYTVDTSAVNTAKSAVSNAQNIIARYVSFSDYGKLLGYKNEICHLVSYNFDALREDVSYGNPWQLIWVFDGDFNTNVVCEGYAKAFQYLCDLSTFNGDIECYTVTGTMTGGTGAGEHMWNIVRMEDGSNYLVDVTNCDSPAVGYDNKLFLQGTSGSLETGYSFNCSEIIVEYEYDAVTKMVFEESRLRLASEAYHVFLEEIVQDGIIYSIADNEATVIGHEGTPTTVVIPDTINGIPVKKIGKMAFTKCSTLVEITIPDSVTVIEDGAYYGDPDYDEGAFCKCSSLVSVHISENSELSYIGKWAFGFCGSLIAIDLPSAVKTLEESCFDCCFALKDIHLPEGLEYIGQNALNSTAIESLYLPSSLEYFNYYNSWGDMDKLKEIHINNNPHFFSIDGILYYNDIPGTVGYPAGPNLFIYPADKQNKEYIVPDFITELHWISLRSGQAHNLEYIILDDDQYFCEIFLENSFFIDPMVKINDTHPLYKVIDGCIYDKTGEKLISVPAKCPADITVCDGTIDIGFRAFYLSHTETVFIPKTVRKIGDRAFDGEWLNYVKTIYYEGTREEWEKIEKTTLGSFAGYPEPEIIYGAVAGFENDKIFDVYTLSNDGTKMQELYFSMAQVNEGELLTFTVTIVSSYEEGLKIEWYDSRTEIWTEGTETWIEGPETLSYYTQENKSDFIIECRVTDGMENQKKVVFHVIIPSFTMTWLDDDWNVIDTTTVEYGIVPTHADPVKAATAEYTYTFKGWMPEIKAVTGRDEIYVATYEATKNSYTITWLNDDDSVIDSTTMEYGTVPTHADPVKAATAEYTYTFTGWTPELEAVTGDATYKATYEAEKNSYTITWLNDDDSVIDTTTVEYGTVPTHADPVKAATAEYMYTFTGWTPEIGAVTEDATYKATYRSIAPFGKPDFTLPTLLTAVEDEAFEGIKATVVYVPDSCTSIGSRAFRNCHNLLQIRIPADCVLGDDVFDGCGTLYIFGTKGSSAETYCNDPAHSNCVFVEQIDQLANSNQKP